MLGRSASLFNSPSTRRLPPLDMPLVRATEPRTLIMHAGGVATPEDARDLVRAGAAGTGATSAIIKARDRGKIVEGFLSAVRQAHDGT
jgi:triosephosphate isomerase